MLNRYFSGMIVTRSKDQVYLDVRCQMIYDQYLMAAKKIKITGCFQVLLAENALLRKQICSETDDFILDCEVVIFCLHLQIILSIPLTSF